MAGDHPDPSVIRSGDEYWAAVTTGSWAPHFTLLRSRDLVRWETVGAVFEKRPAWAGSDFWAPELVEDGGRFFVYYTARRDEGPRKTGSLCVAVATATAPGGPYTDHGPLACRIPERGNVGSIDAAFVRDERGEPYLVWKADGNDAEPDQPTSIFAQRLSADGTKLVGKRREILRNDAPWERHVTEGSSIVRRGGWFYHFYSGNACCGRGCDYALGVARSRSLFGPWEKHPRNPILAANDEWQCPGHGSLVWTPDGRLFLLYHSYRKRPDAFAIGREALLDEVKWKADGWPTINDGRGPSSVAPAPFEIKSPTGKAAAGGGFRDEFDAATLGPEWQWPMSFAQTARTGPGGGWLLLSPGGTGAQGDEWTGAVLGRRATSGDYVATVAVDLSKTSEKARAGLAAYGWRNSATGLAIGGGKLFVWRREGETRQTLATADAPQASNADASRGPFLYLRMQAERGETYRFAYSADGREWKALGGPVAGSHVEGVHVALTVGGPGGSIGAFDWFHVASGR
jgi:beta-xylosidase